MNEQEKKLNWELVELLAEMSDEINQWGKIMAAKQAQIDAKKKEIEELKK